MVVLKRTALYPLHVQQNAKMVPFAGHELPVHYKPGVLKEHIHTREKAGLFDVSHMGQLRIDGPDYETIALALETLIPVDILRLAENRQRYGFLLCRNGGTLDDLMLVNRGNHIFMVVNGACLNSDLAHLNSKLPETVRLSQIKDRALLALQGPAAEAALSALNPAVAQMKFMDVQTVVLNGASCWVSRSGYSGEDGFEISVPVADALALAKLLLENPDVALIGLGARDSLRLEAGLCLYGNDLSTDTSPVAAGLGWAIQGVRRTGGEREGGFPGDDVILKQLLEGTSVRLVGLLPKDRAPMRNGVPLFASATSTDRIGTITSGGYGPTLGAPIAMGYVKEDYSGDGTTLYGDLRGKRRVLKVSPLPFVKKNFKR